MQKFAVIGHPLGHTMSPYIHNRLFSLSGIHPEYRALDIPPEQLCARFDDTLRLLDGINVTIPHKQSVIPMLDSLDESARRYGAVNCIRFGANGSVGYNTDAYGFRSAISAAGIPLEGKVLLLGSGGAARTVAYEAVRAECELTIAVRSGSDGADALSAEIQRETGRPVTIAALTEVHGAYSLVVNATPVGMFPKIGASPLAPEQLDGCDALFDAVYNPRETLLMKHARARGMKIAEGMAMLVRQAVRAHEIWYGAAFSDEQIDATVSGAYEEMHRLFGGEQ